jgi:hypothetical protein
MPPTVNGKTYHGLPNVYPFNKEGFAEGQIESAQLVEYRGISDGSSWHLADGTKLEIWPGGAVFNEHGTLVGWFEARLPEGYVG